MSLVKRVPLTRTHPEFWWDSPTNAARRCPSAQPTREPTSILVCRSHTGLPLPPPPIPAIIWPPYFAPRWTRKSKQRDGVIRRGSREDNSFSSPGHGPGPCASEFPLVSLWPRNLPAGNLDAADRHGLARLPFERFIAAFRRGRLHRTAPRRPHSAAGRRAHRSLEPPSHGDCHPVLDDDPGIRPDGAYGHWPDQHRAAPGPQLHFWA